MSIWKKKMRNLKLFLTKWLKKLKKEVAKICQAKTRRIPPPVREWKDSYLLEHEIKLLKKLAEKEAGGRNKKMYRIDRNNFKQ